MEITLTPMPNSSVTEPISIELGDYTILAGENNSGKTSIINAVIKAQKNIKELKDYRTIFIPADRIQPDQELKASAKTDPFYVAIAELLAPIFDTSIMDKLKTDFAAKKEELIKGVNKILSESGVDDTQLDVKLDDMSETTAIKLAKAFAKDLYPTDVDEVELTKVGTGAQRMILAALIRYYATSKVAAGKGEKTLLVLEEPELCLHPRWKEKLREALERLVKDGVTVLITTHDPFFVKFEEANKIYEVRRDPKTGATQIEEQTESPLLGYRSDAEINYLIFHVASPTYFLELYEYLYSCFGSAPRMCDHGAHELVCADCKKAIAGKTQKALNDWVATQYPSGKVPELSKIRNNLGHPGATKPSDKDIREGIERLRELIPNRAKEPGIQ